MFVLPEGPRAFHLRHPPDIRAVLADINRSFLQLLVERGQLDSAAGDPFVEELQPYLLRLASHVEHVAARVPFLLLDIEFANAAWWNAIAHEACASTLVYGVEPTASRSRTVNLGRSTLMLAWHVARTDREASLIELGVSRAVMAQLKLLHPLHIEAIAERHHDRIRPRWEGRVNLWRQLLCEPQDAGSLRTFTLRALTSLAAHPRS